MKRIQALVMDVDGTMTDGKIYMGSQGECMKAFNIKDGYGIHEILPLNGITAIVLTGRESQIVANRSRELEIPYVFQNVKDKKTFLEDFVKEQKYGFESVAYIGDDVIDVEAMRLCGMRGCPADAVDEVKEICQFISGKKGGDGAIRDFIEWIIRNDGK